MNPKITSLGALAALSLAAACDTVLEPLAQVTQAITAEDTAASSDVAADSTDDAADDAAPPEGCDGRGGPDGGPGGRGPGGPPPDGDGPFGAVEVAVCAPPVADGVDLGRPPRGRGHLAAVYDEDENQTLDDTELQALQDDAAAGCAARNAKVLADFDDDADGALSQTEWDTARAAFRAAHDEERAALDTDADGVISEAEHEAARAALIATWDTDGSGDLDADERAAMREDLQALVRAGERLPPLPFFGAHGRHRGPPPDDAAAAEGEGDTAG